MSRSKFSFDPARLQRVLRSLQRAALVDSDNRFYECAYTSQADYIVTGNRKHFTKDLPPTRIVGPREVVAIMEAGLKSNR